MRATKGRSRQKRYSNKEVKHFIKNHKDEKLRKAYEKQKRIEEETLRRKQRTSYNDFLKLHRKLKVRFWPKDESLNESFADIYLHGYRK